MKLLLRSLALCLVSMGWQLVSLAPAPVSVTLGKREVVLADGQYGLHYFPDECLAIVPAKSGCRVIMAAGVHSVLLEGPSMQALGLPKEVLERGKPGTFDNGYAGISAVWRAPSGDLLAIYHGEDQEGIKGNDAGIPGFYCTVALAVSKDDGLTFEKRRPILTGHLPKVAGGRFDQGVGEPCLVAEPGGKFLYLYYSSHERLGGRGVEIGLARCPVEDALRPAAWQKFHDGAFTEPGLGGNDSPVITAGVEHADALFPHVVYLPSLRQFAMVYCVNNWSEGDVPEQTGIYMAFSRDGIEWPRAGIRQIWKTPVIASLNHPVAWHPTLVLDEGATKNEIKGWLYYGYSESWGHRPPNQPHQLARRSILFTSPSTD